MGGAASRTATTQRPITPPLALNEFKNLSDSSEPLAIPEIPEKRKLTNKPCLIFFGVVLVALIPFLIYTLVYSDINRFCHGYDQCGNICGEKNALVNGISCSGVDMETKPYLMFDSRFNFNMSETTTPRHCTEKCDETKYMIIMNRCVMKDNASRTNYRPLSTFMKELAQGLKKASGQIVGMVLIALGTTVALVLLFRYATKYIVWGILIGCLVGCGILSAVLWIYNSTAEVGDSRFMVLAIFFTILTLVLGLIILCMYKRIKLVIMLFKEAMKAIFDMPLLLLEPLLTFVAVSIAIVFYAYISILIGTSGTLQLVQGSTYIEDDGNVQTPVVLDTFYEYVPNTVMIFTFILNTFILLWMCQFINGCQQMVLSGTVSAWYFCRDRAALVSPIYNSFYNLIKYHLGTVACGSLIITIVTIVRALIKSLVNSRYRALVDCCLAPIEDFLKYLTKNAYIQTAMHGQAFFKSGKRAARLLLANVVNVVALNSVGDFVLSVALILIMLVTILSGVLMYDKTNEYFYAAIVLCAIIAMILGACVLTVFETAIDTLFLCYCEDSIINDGTNSPYFMSTNLMQFVEESKTVVPKK